jgi:superoxide dismutase, Fe-Mn family
MTTHRPGPPPRTYEPRRFDLKGLAGISNAQIEEHLALYAGYVAQVNALSRERSEIARGQASGKSPGFADLTRRLGFEYNGMILHEYYFGNLCPAAEPEPAASSKLGEALAGSFGSVELWRSDFQAIGEMRGIGWVILFQDPVTDRLTNHWITLHQDGIPAGFKPLLVMDVWEHAFMRDYRASERARYVEAFFRNIDWSVVETRLREERALRVAA